MKKRREKKPSRPRRAKTPAPAPRARRPASKVLGSTSPAPEREPVADERSEAEPSPRTTIAGVGASAGGLEAFSALLSALPENPGLALVLVAHLAPQHESALPTLLASTTKLRVVQAADGMKVEPNRVYVIPPNVQMSIDKDVLHLLPRPTDDSQYVPVDIFFRSLADSAQQGAIGVILSGTASDGAVGIRDIKSVGGITLAQEPLSAKYDGMPRAAIATGMVDLVLPPDRLAAELVEIARHPYLHRADPVPAAEHDDDADGRATLRDEQLQRVFKLLRKASGVDFRHYKLPTIERRLQRRMVLHRITRVETYLRRLHEDPGEVQALYQDLLIHVTRFFREPDSFRALADHILPQIVARQDGDGPIRVWIAGCSSGEEAYSITIALLENLGDRVNAIPIQVFATDVSEHAIEHARNGIYPESIAVDVSPERLRRFFTKSDGGYRVTKAVRDLCVFARQDLARDPPFSKLDLVVCRNVLIYMTSALQHRVLSVFHYALKPSGFLVLGHAESIGNLSELFAIEDKRHRIYRKMPGDPAMPALSFNAERLPPIVTSHRRASATGGAGLHEADRIVLERYAPPGVIVDDELQILQFRGQTGAFLEPAPGDPSVSLLKMAREGLLHGVRSVFHTARKSGKPVRKDGVKVRQNGHWHDVGIEVIPLTNAGRPHFLVLFHNSLPPAEPTPDVATPAKAGAKRGTKDDDRVRRLESELAASRDYLRSIIQEVEAANEELQSANEEILSSNEELQSTNEELDTAKEELQSTNEELNTLNEELHGRNTELGRVNSDLVNLLGSIEIAIVIVARDLRIRRFTPLAERLFNLIASDVGRPIGHIKPAIDMPDLEGLITRVIDTVSPQEREVRDAEGRWFAIRVRPYKNIENRIDGAVLALIDIQTAKQQDGAVRYAEAVFDAMPVPLLVLDPELRIRQANDAFCNTFGYTPDSIQSRKLLDLGQGAWSIPQLQQRLDAAFADGARIDDLPLTHRFPRIGSQTLRLILRRLDGVDEGPPSLLLMLVGDAPTAGN
jgi:two-component system CheB/CheR fusion protein